MAESKRTPEDRLLADEERLIEQLRAEAYDVKDCFTKYSFQALAIVSAVLALIIRYVVEVPYVGLSALLLVVLMQTVASIGTHKYSTANRLLGFELYLQRVRRLEEKGLGTQRLRMLRGIGWEEAMRAWRIVQPTFFRFLYVVGSLNPSRIDAFFEGQRSWVGRVQHQFFRRRPETLHSDLTDRQDRPLPALVGHDRWFEPKSMIARSAEYYSGGYLQTVLNVIYVVTAICFVPAFAACALIWIKEKQIEVAIALFLITVVVAAFTLNRFRLTSARRILLETGLLSIHSCAIMWHVAATAHFRTLDVLSAGPQHNLGYKGYTHSISEIGVEAAENVHQIYSWLDHNRRR